MPVKITKPAINLRDRLAALTGLLLWHRKHGRGVTLLPNVQLTGDGTKTEFALPAGMRPHTVSQAGLTKAKGSAEAWTEAFDGLIYSVKFAVAPANGDKIIIQVTGA